NTIDIRCCSTTNIYKIMMKITTQLVCYQNFFFQAEDGIRDGHVTGVQTCALPIYNDIKRINFHYNKAKSIKAAAQMIMEKYGGRSEERRVGKECRFRWWSYP